MSTDWIKMRVDLRTHPKVVRIASALKSDRLRVIGGLFAVWSVFDAHSVDGFLDGYTPAAVDEDLGWKGFAAAMLAVDWLESSPEGMRAPRFDEHNGQSAKRRAAETERKRAEREADKQAKQNGQLSASDADEKRTREEKRREEKEIPPNPRKRGNVHGFPPGFESFWSAYPRKTAKASAAKAFARLQPSPDLLALMLVAVAAQSRCEAWVKDGGQFIPHAATWINGRRWEDEAGSAPSSDVFAGAH